MKRTCYGCGARFYDLHRSPIVCPVCDAVYDPERQPRIRRGGTVIRDEPVLPVALAGADRLGVPGATLRRAAAAMAGVAPVRRPSKFRLPLPPRVEYC